MERNKIGFKDNGVKENLTIDFQTAGYRKVILLKPQILGKNFSCFGSEFKVLIIFIIFFFYHSLEVTCPEAISPIKFAKRLLIQHFTMFVWL